MTTKKQPLRQGEKILFGIFGAFFLAAVVGYAALEAIRLRVETPLFPVRTHFDLSSEGRQGSVVFRESGCTSCHRAMRNGTNMGLSLDGVGSKHSREWLARFLAEPERTYDAATLDHGRAPKEAAYVARLPERDRHLIAVFLSELRADRGSSSAPAPPEGRSPFIDNMVKMWAPEDWKDKYPDVRESNTAGDPQGVERRD